MSATPSNTPPRLLSALAAKLLPPERREQVLGDLEERFRAAPPARALQRYLFEVVTVVPAILFTQLRSWSAGPGVPRPLQLGSGVTTVRAQVEEFQHENYCRLLLYVSVSTLLSLFLAWQMFSTDFWFGRLFAVAFIAILLLTVQQHSVRGSARSVPEEDSLPALIAFHRRELARRCNFLRTLWYWKMAPLAVPILVIFIVKRNSVALSTVLWTIGCYALASFAARRQARGIQKRIDELGAQVDSLDGDGSL